MIVHDKLFAMLDEAGLTSYAIRKMKNPILSQATLTRLRAGEGGIDHNTLNRICEYFNCQPGDLIEYIPDEK